MINDNSDKCYICHKIIFQRNRFKKLNDRFKIVLYPLFNNRYYFSLIKSCKCYNKKAHPICIILNFINIFQIKCDICNYVYNIKINQLYSKEKIFYIAVTLFFILIIISFSLIISILLIFKNNFITSNKNFYPIKVFIGICIFIILILLSIILMVKKNQIIRKGYTYKINIIEYKHNTQNIINYELLNNFFYWLYNNKISFLIEIKESHKFFEKNILIQNLNLLRFIETNNEEYRDEEKLKNNKFMNSSNIFLNNIVKKTEKNQENSNLELQCNKDLESIHLKLDNDNILNIKPTLNSNEKKNINLKFLNLNQNISQNNKVISLIKFGNIQNIRENPLLILNENSKNSPCNLSEYNTPNFQKTIESNIQNSNVFEYSIKSKDILTMKNINNKIINLES